MGKGFWELGEVFGHHKPFVLSEKYPDGTLEIALFSIMDERRKIAGAYSDSDVSLETYATNVAKVLIEWAGQDKLFWTMDQYLDDNYNGYMLQKMGSSLEGDFVNYEETGSRFGVPTV